MNQHDDNQASRLNGAVSSRLRRLRQRKLDTEQLKGRVRLAISGGRSNRRFPKWFTTSWAIAAGLLLAVVVAVFVLIDGRPVLASTAQLAAIHLCATTGRSDSTAVDSFDAARQVLKSRWSDCPAIPRTSVAVVKGCCICKVGNESLACVELTIDGRPITLAVARCQDIRFQTSSTISRDGLECHSLSSDNVNIVVLQRDGVWLCVMGELPATRLVDVVTSFSN